MKQNKSNYWLLAAALAYAFVCYAVTAQTNAEVPFGTNIVTPQVIDPVKAPLPTNLLEYWQFAIPIVVPLLIAGLKKIGPKIPKRVIPLLSPALGIVLGIIMQKIEAQHFSWMTTTISGLLGWAATGLREAVDQNVVQPNQPAEEKIAELNESIKEVQKNPKATS